MSVSSEKRQEILQLLAAGKITVDEAADMLAGTVDVAPIVEKQPEPDQDIDDMIKVAPDPGAAYVRPQSRRQASWLRVRVSDMKTGKNKVTVNVPMRLVRFGLSVGSRFAPELEGVDWDELDGFLSAEKGMLVDVQDEEDGEHVQIFVE